MKRKNFESDREKKIPNILKKDKVAKHRKSIYNMLVEEEDDSDFIDDDSDVDDNATIHSNVTYTKRH
jgi:hypothetical protein